MLAVAIRAARPSDRQQVNQQQHCVGAFEFRMTEPVNLRLARKRRARETAAREATENRAAHGVSKVQARRTDADRADSQRKLDQHKIENRIETGECQ